MQKILLISGKAGSGKDTAGEIVGWTRMAFADALKSEVSEKFNIPRELFDTRQGKNQQNHLGITNRELLIKYGLDKRNKDPNYWVNKVKENIIDFRKDANVNVVVTDFRFPNEFLILPGADVKTLRIDRPGIKIIDSPSENSLDDFDFDYYISNDSDLNSFKEKLSKIDWIYE